METKIVLQSFMLPRRGMYQPAECYFHTSGSYDASSGEVRLKKHEWLVSDAWFNVFDADFWRENTCVKEFGFRFRLRGKCRLTLWYSTDPDDHKQRMFFRRDFEPQVDRMEVMTPFEHCPLSEVRGMITFEILASRRGTVFGGAEFFTRTRPVRKPEIGMVVCTFKREAFLMPNLKQWNEELFQDPVWSERFRLFLVDNAGTLPESVKSERVHLFRNPNSGGAGGFSRGMMEAERSDCTHILLMDDDLVLHGDILKRAWRIAAFLNDKCSLSAAMVNLDSQMCILHEWGGILMADAPGAGMNRPLGFRKDITKFHSVFREKCREFCYGAWWWFLFPAEVLRTEKIGLAYPFFVKGDDIDFSLRLAARNYRILFPAGFAVWHEPFFNKLSPFHEYLAQRNQLILSALHRISYAPGRVLMKRMSELIFSYHYETAELTLAGIEDFLRGPEKLVAGDPDAPLAYRTRIHLEKPRPLGEEILTVNRPLLRNEKKLHRLFRLLTLNGLILPASRDEVAIHLAWNAGVWSRDTYRCRKATYVRASVGECYTLERDRIRIFRLFFRTVKTLLALRFRRERVARAWRGSYERFTREEFWKQYLKLESAERSSQ